MCSATKGLDDGRLPKNRTCKTSPDDIIYTLVFFSTFEELKLPFKGPMEDAGVIQPDSKYMVLFDSMYEYVRVCISIIRGCKYSWLAHIFLSFLDPTYNVLCLGDASVHL